MLRCAPVAPSRRLLSGSTAPQVNRFLTGERRGFCTSLTVARGVLLEGAVYRVAVTATQARGSP